MNSRRPSIPSTMLWNTLTAHEVDKVGAYYMSILVGMGWIILGIVYVLYKIGSEEFRGGVVGGILTVVLPIVFFLLIGGSFWLASQVSEEYGMLVLMCIIIVSLFTLWFRARKKDAKEREEKEAWYNELCEKAHKEADHDHQ